MRRSGRAAITGAILAAATVVGVHLGATAAAATPAAPASSHSTVIATVDAR